MGKLEKQLDTFLRRRPRLGQGVYLAKTAVVLGDVKLGDYASVWYHAVLRGDINRIVVGHHTNIQGNAVLHLSDDFPCLLGNYVTVDHAAIVHACTIGDRVPVGMGASATAAECSASSLQLFTSHPPRSAARTVTGPNSPAGWRPLLAAWF
jgi:carbonic anhydrase/acetyltransferase-like protein (isoleucine patch superfamily)